MLLGPYYVGTNIIVIPVIVLTVGHRPHPRNYGLWCIFKCWVSSSFYTQLFRNLTGMYTQPQEFKTTENYPSL